MSTRIAIAAAAAVALSLPLAIGAAASAQDTAKAETRERPTEAKPEDYGVTENDRRVSNDPMLVGAFVYAQRCSVCHDKNANGPQKYGPHLEGIVGRKAGATEWPNQTSTLNGSEVVWDENNLNALLQNPDKMMPGVQMDVKIRFNRSRKALIAYLKSL